MGHSEMLHFDYETFSEVDIKKHGGHYYARDPSTFILCVAWAVGDDPVKLITEHDDPADFIHAIKHSKYHAGHNVTFEWLITQYAGKRQWNLPRIDPESLVCTQAISLQKGYPRSLDGSAQALGLIEQKDPRGHRLILKLSKPRRPSQKNPETRWTTETAPQDFADFYEYCIQDVKTEREIFRKLGPLPANEQRIWLRDFKMNRRGIPINTELLYSAIDARDTLLKTIEADATKNKPFDTLGQRAVVMAWCKEQGYELDDYTADTLEASIKDSSCPSKIKQVLAARQQCSRTSLKKFDAMSRAICDDGTVKGCFVYHGAHTGRWAGSLIQPQNLPRPTIKEHEIDQVIEIINSKKYKKLLKKFDDPMGALVSCIRASIQPEKGKRLFASDYSNVEGRVLFALAGEENGLRVFREQRDLYMEMAAHIFQVKYSDVEREYLAGDDYKRRVGKLAILGLGYQMGWKKFQLTSEGKDVVFDAAFAKAVVDAYREAYPGVTRFWYNCEEAAQNAVINSGTVYKVNKYISFKMKGTTLLCRLPSGRLIHYPFAKVEQRSAPWGGTKPTLTYMVSEKGQWLRTKTFGGSIVENIVQATCRDLLTHAEESLEKKKYKTRMTVHDELVLTTGRAKASTEEVTRCMEDLPSWAAGWPITAETWEGPRFRK